MRKKTVSATVAAGLVLSFAASANAQTPASNVSMLDNFFAQPLSLWNNKFEVAFGGVRFFLLPGEKQFLETTPSPSGSCKSTKDRTAAPIKALVFNYSKTCTSASAVIAGCPGSNTFQPRPKMASSGISAMTGYYGPGQFLGINPVTRQGGVFTEGAPWFNGAFWVAKAGSFGGQGLAGTTLTVDWGSTSVFWPSSANANTQNVNVLGAGVSNLMMNNANNAYARVAQGLQTALNSDTQYCPAGFVDSRVVLP